MDSIKQMNFIEIRLVIIKIREFEISNLTVTFYWLEALVFDSCYP